MQQGDCNAPSTFQQLMMVVFRDYIAWFVHIYLDNIFIYSSSVKEHEAHLVLVFDRLCKDQLYLSQDKVDLYSLRWIAWGTLSPTLAFTPMQIRCRKYETGDSLVATMRSNDFWD